MLRIRFLHGSFILLLLIFTTIAGADEDSYILGFYTQGDAVFFDGDTIDLIEKNTFKDGLYFPRARFYTKGKNQSLTYFFAYDAAEELIREAFFGYEIPHFRFYFGQFKVPYYDWFITSRRESEFLEFPLPSIAFNPGFRTGFQSRWIFDPITLSFCIFGPSIENRILNNQIHGKKPLAALMRLTFSPIHSERKVLHLATAGIFQDTDSLERLRFRAFPEVQSRPNHFLVDTGFIYHCQNYFGQELEAIVILKQFSLYSEYQHVRVTRTTKDLVFDGYAASIDYFLTGEHYVYSLEDGAIRGISQIRHGYGAFQFIARYSSLDLISGEVNGGREHNFTIGFDWIVNKNLKFVLNYITADANPSCNDLDRKLRIIALRCQLGDEASVCP